MGPTIYDIAREANVSIGAVSKALNNRSGVSGELRERIKGIAHRLQYSPYIKSRENGLMTTKPREIAVVFGHAGAHLMDAIQSGIDAALENSGYRELRFTVRISEMLQESTKKFVIDKIFNDSQVCGALFVFIPLTDADVARFQRTNVHIVQLNNSSHLGQSVSIDDFGAAYDATNKLIQFGHRTIGFVLPNDVVDQVWRDRLTGYRKALEDNGIRYDGSCIGNESTFIPMEAGLVTRELIVNNPKITAVIYGSDLQALGGLRMLREMHLRVPEDVAVVGFDDMNICDLVEPPLASVHLPMFEQGKVGTEMLLEAIKTKTFKDEKQILKTNLILRRSGDRLIPQPTWVSHGIAGAGPIQAAAHA